MFDFLSILYVIIVLGAIGLTWYFKSPKTKGKIGEAKIHKKLMELDDDYFVFKDVVLKNEDSTTQIDHLVVSKYGIFAIETKNYRGQIIGNDNSQYWTQIIVTDVTYWKKWYKTYTYVKKNKLYNPIKQSLGHVYAIKKLIKEWPQIIIVPIVVFTNKADLSRVNSDDLVINENQLLETIRNYCTTYLSDADVQNIVERINVKDYRDWVSDSEHVRNVKYIQKVKEDKISLGICPKCGGMLVERQGPYGSFIGCSNYPKCKFTKN